MERIFRIVTFVYAIAIPASVANAAVVDGRYYSPGNEFSIEYNRDYQAEKETTKKGLIVVEFPFRPPWTNGIFYDHRTIQWYMLDQAIAADQYEETAKAIIAANNKGNGSEKYVITNKMLSSDGMPPNYIFFAAAHSRGLLVGWSGVVLFFGNRVGFVTYTFSSPSSLGQDSFAPGTLPGGEFLDWAMSLQPKQ